MNPVPRMPPPIALKPTCGVKVTFGAICPSAVTSFWKDDSICFALTVVTATDKSCWATERFVPVTMTSSSARSLASCASAAVPANSADTINSEPW